MTFRRSRSSFCLESVVNPCTVMHRLSERIMNVRTACKIAGSDTALGAAVPTIHEAAFMRCVLSVASGSSGENSIARRRIRNRTKSKSSIMQSWSHPLKGLAFAAEDRSIYGTPLLHREQDCAG